MLRAALPLSRRAVLRPVGLHVQSRTSTSLLPKRGFADKSSDLNTKPSISDPKPPVLPGSKAVDVPPPPGPVSPGSPEPPAGISKDPKTLTNVPLTPPPPAGSNRSSPSTSEPAILKPKRKRRLRKFLLSLILLTSVGFAGGVAYSLRSDNFHDFFTEYVPFGEEAVLYFEEREFRKRFPRLLNSRRTADNSPKINIPQKSGLSSKVAGEGNGNNLEARGPHMSALDAKVPASVPNKAVPPTSKPSQDENKSSAPSKAEAQKSARKEASTGNAGLGSAPKVAKVSPSKGSPRLPEVNEPSVYVPISRIDPLQIPNANEPLVQDLVKILNDIITVVNADNATGKYTSTFEKAKSELERLGTRIMDLRSSEQDSAKSQIQKSEAEFDNAARELVRRLEEEMRTQESKWRDEVESERQKIARSYEERLKTETEKSNEVNQRRLKNELLEQALVLKKQFTESVRHQVEAERNGRLSKLSELSSSVNELEKLTADWNSVIDSNLKTQHLQVAVEAVRSSLESADRPRPFIKELAALKEIAAGDAIVNGAIASISPASYQRGIPTSAQLIDRFRRVADEVRKASLLPEDAGVASHAASLVLSKILFKKQGRAVGDDVESVLTRTETLLEEGNLDDAAREMNTLKGWAKTLSSDWLVEVRRVLEVRQALDVIATEARLQSLVVD